MKPIKNIITTYSLATFALKYIILLLLFNNIFWFVFYKLVKKKNKKSF